MKRSTRRFSSIPFAPITLMLCAPVANAQEWIRQFGTNVDDAAYALAPHGAGGVIVAGTTEGNLAGGVPGLGDAFLARYDGTGIRLWLRQFGTSSREEARALAPDAAGGVMVAGYSEGSLAGPNAGGQDAFLARYGQTGNQLWILQFGTAFDDRALALAPDGAGGFFLAGKTHGSMAAPNVNSSGDVFLAHFDAAGAQSWLRQFGTAESEKPYALAPDGAGGVYVTGETTGSLGAPFAGIFDAFLTRFDASGNQLWVRQLGTNGDEAGTGLAPDGAGGVLIGGFTGGDLGGPNSGEQDAFLARYARDGQQLWIRQFGTNEFDSAQGLASDGAGGALLVGVTAGDLGGPLTGVADAFLAHYDTDGNRVSIRQFGSTALDVAQSVASDTAGAVMIAGFTQGDLGGPSAGQDDAFLARFTIGACPCACDWDGSPACSFFDFLFFQNAFVLSDPCACEFDGDPACTFFDFLFFQNEFVLGCP